MHTTDNPYGYWITKTDIFPVIDSCSHARVAVEILSGIFGIAEDTLWHRFDDIYRVMFRLGFVRVVNEGGGHAVEYRHDAKLSKMQKEWVKDANYVDKIDYKRWSV